MKNIQLKLLLLMFMAALGKGAYAQNTGIAVSFFNLAFYANSSPVTQGYMGLGIERNVGDHISLKLELNNGFQILYSVSNGKVLDFLGGNNQYHKDLPDTGSTYQEFDYHWSIPSFDINYQSKFFFAGNDHTGGYMAMGIGFRSVKYHFHVGSVNDYGSSSGEVPSDINNLNDHVESVSVIPLILRIGMRGDLKGFYPDFSFGLGYNIGHGKELTNSTIVNKYHLTVPKLTGIAITGSIAFGIGW